MTLMNVQNRNEQHLSVVYVVGKARGSNPLEV